MYTPFEDFTKISSANFLLFGEQPLRVKLLVLVVPGRRRVSLLGLLLGLKEKATNKPSKSCYNLYPQKMIIASFEYPYAKLRLNLMRTLILFRFSFVHIHIPRQPETAHSALAIFSCS